MNASGKYHIDIKPQNIVYDGSKFRLIDFGISKNLKFDSPENPFFKNQRYGYWPAELTLVNYPWSKGEKKRTLTPEVNRVLMNHIKTYFQAVTVGSNLSAFVKKIPKTLEDIHELLEYFSGLTTEDIYAKIDTWGLGMTLIDIHSAMLAGAVKDKLGKFIKSVMIIKTKERMSAEKLAQAYQNTFNARERPVLKQIRMN
jgi:serine/threonine protein kinase